MNRNIKLLLICGVCLGVWQAGSSDAQEQSSWIEKRKLLAEQRVLPKDQYGREDPFAPLKAVQEVPKLTRPKTELSLNGIVWSETAKNAFINGILVQENDEIGDYKVLEIRKNDVLLEAGGKRYLLTSYGLIEQSPSR
ncbi:MAG: hypothetical protein ABIJ41_05810 [Candidatus Omnitrophota bacterium]